MELRSALRIMFRSILVVLYNVISVMLYLIRVLFFLELLSNTVFLQLGTLRQDTISSWIATDFYYYCMSGTVSTGGSIQMEIPCSSQIQYWCVKGKYIFIVRKNKQTISHAAKSSLQINKQTHKQTNTPTSKQRRITLG